MPGVILRNVAAATIIGSVALLFVRQGPIRVILRIALGIMLILATFLPFSGQNFRLERVVPTAVISVDAIEEEQTVIYEETLSDTAEKMIEAYFDRTGKKVDVSLEMDNGTIGRVILYPLQTYEWTMKDAEAFAAWSGIPQEKQEWIWNS